MENLHFVAIPADDDRPEVAVEDRVRLAESIAKAGFMLCEGMPDPPARPTNVMEPADAAAAGGLSAWHDGFEATVVFDDDWTVHIMVPLTLVDVERDADLGAEGLRLMAKLIGAAADVADPYVGFVSVEADDNISFVVDERPFVVEEPLALLYLGPRYLEDNGFPDYAADAAIDIPAGAGRVIIMDPVALT